MVLFFFKRLERKKYTSYGDCRALALTTLVALAGCYCCVAADGHSTTTTVAESSQQLQPSQQQNGFGVDKYPETKNLREPPSYLNRLFTEQYSKRAAMRGFQGMRGKKSDDLLDEDYYYEKRAPMGFQGMRGKKAQLDDDDFDKRAPMGFQGMRGKKNIEEVIEELEKRAMMGFQGMRGKKAEEYEEDLSDLAPYYDEAADEWHKRTPNMGFQGMRGRKSYADDMEKRTMQLGFHGMRGKKGLYEPDEMMVPLVAADGYVDKRPMMMGFHGMRGKRSANYYEADGYGARYMDKRSPYRFFGSRGKKNPRWELRGKFVGVRGKKWSQPPPRLDVLAKQLAASYADDAWH